MGHIHLDTSISDLALVQLEQRHAQELYDLTVANYQYLSQWLPWVKSIHSPEDTETFIHHYETKYQLHSGLQCGLLYQNTIIGVIGIDIMSGNRSGAIGYWIGEQYQGNGYTTVACQSFVNYCFDSLALNRIEIRCAVDNKGSNAIPRKLGFAFEGVLREAEYLNDHYHDLNIYSLLSKDRHG